MNVSRVRQLHVENIVFTLKSLILGCDKIIVDGRLFLRYMCTQLTNCILGGASAKKYKINKINVTDYEKNFYPLLPVKIRVLSSQQDI